MMTQVEVEPRVMRGYAIIAKGDNIEEVAEGIYRVPSQNGNGSYTVTIKDNGQTCTCPDYVHRHEQVGNCKHLFAVLFYLQVQSEAKVNADAVVRCKWCNSADIIKYGHEAGKQVHKCMGCLRKFVPESEFERLKYDPQTIAVVLDLYFKGTSLRKISDHLKLMYGLNVNFSTLYVWIKKYVAVIDAYVKNLVPATSGQLNADEMKVKVNGEWKWLWSIMDKKTRFTLASQISEKREIEDARRLFVAAKGRLNGQKVDRVVTDGLHAYKKAFNKEIWTIRGPRTEHISHIRLAGDMNNNIMERLNGTRRERDKVLRGMKNDSTPIRSGFDVYYNFIRPHQALDGKTPAEVANIKLDLSQNKWLGLLKQSLQPLE